MYLMQGDDGEDSGITRPAEFQDRLDCMRNRYRAIVDND